MYKSIKIALQQNNINFPKFWDQKSSVDFFLETDSEDLAEELWVTPAVWKKWSKEIFPNKPNTLSINKYLKSILAQIETKELDTPVAPTYKGLSFGKQTATL